MYDSTPRIVTDYYMATDAEFDAFTTQYAEAFLHVLKKCDIPHLTEVETYIRKDPISEGGLYYLVDHAHQRISWLESVSTSEMGLLASSSDSHLGELSYMIDFFGANNLQSWCSRSLTGRTFRTSHLTFTTQSRSLILVVKS